MRYLENALPRCKPIILIVVQCQLSGFGNGFCGEVSTEEHFWILQAAWVAGQYADIIFNEQRNFSSAMHRVVAALKDQELPVRVDSVVALRSFVESCKGEELLLPCLISVLLPVFSIF